MPPRIDLTGKTFGRLKVVGFAGANGGLAMWRCRCSCGGGKIACGQAMKAGKIKSCGCLQRQNRRKFFGLPRTPVSLEDLEEIY